MTTTVVLRRVRWSSRIRQPNHGTAIAAASQTTVRSRAPMARRTADASEGDRSPATATVSAAAANTTGEARASGVATALDTSDADASGAGTSAASRLSVAKAIWAAGP